MSTMKLGKEQEICLIMGGGKLAANNNGKQDAITSYKFGEDTFY